jgi:hypothetical protein
VSLAVRRFSADKAGGTARLNGNLVEEGELEGGRRYRTRTASRVYLF